MAVLHARPPPSRWTVALCAAISIIFSLIQTPVALRDIANDKKLDATALHAHGEVVSHDARSGKRRHRSTAKVIFSVHGKQYENLIQGAGAHPEHLPRGAKVLVRYIPDNPSISRVVVARAETNRFTSLELLGLWLLSAVLGMSTYRLYRPPKEPRKNSP